MLIIYIEGNGIVGEKQYIGYHGTEKDKADCIIRQKNFSLSNLNTEWLGTGIYFFIDKCALSNAKKWAINVTRRYKSYAVVEASISVSSDLLLDLRNEEWMYTYDTYRNDFIRQIIQRGLNVETNALKFDCALINMFCKEYGIQAVIQQRYIKLEKFDYSDREIPNSYISNCTILCVRLMKCINKESIKIKAGI